MSALFYAQHVLGMGHLFRSLAIARAMAPEPVLLVTGGPHPPAALPGNVRHLPLPPLMMDADFAGVFPVDDHGRPLHADDAALREELVARRFMERADRLLRTLDEERPDLILVELYPFGRKRFGQEIQPLLHRARCRNLPVVCSLRDVLVEKKDQAAFETRVLEALHRCFTGLLVHGDETFLPLDATFSRVADIAIPLAYTGYVAPDPVSGDAVRETLGLEPGEALALGSVGGGAVGAELLRALLAASVLLARSRRHRLLLFTGPFMPEQDAARLRDMAAALPWARLERFSPAFQGLLAAADLSVSLAGYNTLMGLLVAGTPGLVLPFDQNREQRLRAEALAARGAQGVLTVLAPEDLEPGRLARRMEESLAMGRAASPTHGVRLDGAAVTAATLRAWRQGRTS